MRAASTSSVSAQRISSSLATRPAWSIAFTMRAADSTPISPASSAWVTCGWNGSSTVPSMVARVRVAAPSFIRRAASAFDTRVSAAISMTALPCPIRNARPSCPSPGADRSPSSPAVATRSASSSRPASSTATVRAHSSSSDAVASRAEANADSSCCTTRIR